VTVTLGPDLELQGAVVAVISADTDVKSLIGSPPRINPAQFTTWPGSYIMIGEGHSVPDLAECIDGSEVYLDIHIWSRKDTSFADAKKIAATIWAALRAASITLTENRLLTLLPEGQQYLRDPDGQTLHVVLTLKALCEPN
jgi:hypothetical protein